ncbi:MAG: hypothetical protein JXB05_15440 [Myxococcaceae bacterium]|nr:hypothetical protein [Myxococcaceae bacterium]
MNRLVALAAMLGLTVVGCAHSVPVAQRLQEEEARCALVQTLMREPVPVQHVAELSAEGKTLPVQVAVFVRTPEESLLERFFESDASLCGDTRFRVVRELLGEGLVLYLQETPDGYTYDARRAGPEDLSMGGAPQGMVRRRAEGGWMGATL